MQVDLVMPKMGESIAEATILKWLKKPGDSIELDEAVLEIATDKVDSEVPSSVAGTLTEVLYQEGDVVAVGQVIARISTGVTADAKLPEIVPFVPELVVEVKSVDVQPTQNTIISHSNNEKIASDRFYSPLVMNIARSEGIAMNVLDAIPGTGKDGRLTKKDILLFVENGGNTLVAEPQPMVSVNPVTPVQSNGNAPKVADSPKPTPVPSEVILSGGDEIIEMDRMRKLIADHMVMSKQTSPHVTSFVEADVTNIVQWRDKNKNIFEKREGEKITFTPIFIECVIKAIKDYPLINVTVNGTQIIKKRAINIGMAAALPSGNLIVPVIKNADTKNLIGLTKEVNQLANKARNNQLKPDEISGGTFTVTNVGTFGNVMGTPIINQPQVAILALGAIKKKPVVMETEYGDIVAIRQMMFLSLSYDHRVVDGMLGGSFLRRIADYMEAFDINTKI